jgi:hypothetical protein
MLGMVGVSVLTVLCPSRQVFLDQAAAFIDGELVKTGYLLIDFTLKH